MKTPFGHIFLSLLLGTQQVVGRERWLERNNKPVFLYPRRFGQEQPPVLQKLQNACPGQVCGVLAGQAVTPLLAAQPECSQQDMADQIIDASRQFDVDTQANIIAIAQEYRQAEKNTPPDFGTNPPTLRNSVFCQKAPKNSELDGLVQAQDPANDPNVFFDPEKKQSVRKGEQPNTSPFGGSTKNEAITTSGVKPTPTRSAAGTAVRVHVSQLNTECPPAVTVTVSGTNPAAASLTNAVTVTVGNPSQTNIPPPAASPSGVADFGSCSVPEVEFGVGFDNRKETSFRPVDPVSYPHGSAQNINIITQFICDSLTNACGANQDAKDLCDSARSAASSATVGTGAQADAFNGVFGIKTDFANIAPVDNQGNRVSGTGSVSSINISTSTITKTVITTNNDFATPAVTITVASTASATTPATTVSGDGNVGSAGNIGNFGSCSIPEIEFGAGFDGRRETSFRPADSASFDHGSDQNINLIAQFVCGQLSSSCKADQAAQDTCDRATSAATSTTPTGSGAQADAFNAAFGIQTRFVSVQQIDDKGKPVGSINNAVRIRSNSPLTTFAARAVPIAIAASLSTVDFAYKNLTSAWDVVTYGARDLGNDKCGF